MLNEDIAGILKSLGVTDPGHPTRTLVSSVTTAWGVDWDEDLVARDVMQNFFDANRDHLDAIRVERQGRDVRVSAPSPFLLARLFYLGSEKGDDEVGEYGEGFKVAATCLLRDHGVTPIAASGREVLVLRVADQAVSGTELYPVEYDFYTSEKETVGALLLLHGSSKKLASALSQGMDHFLYSGNRLLGPQLWASNNDDFMIYDSTDGKGHVFYRKLRRGDMDGIPLVLVIGKPYEALEKKIRHDRDRNAFGETLLGTYYNLFARYALREFSEGQRIVVGRAKGIWERGHPLLSQIASVGRKWPPKATEEMFGDGYYARSPVRDERIRLEIEVLERGWRNEGRIALPEYFKNFGVLNARDFLWQTEQKAAEESRSKGRRAPTAAEAGSIQVLSNITRLLAPEVMAIFRRKSTVYTVATSEALLGELREGHRHNSCEVFLAAQLFASDFSHALAAFLHEHVHIFGFDGSRGFTDALTRLLEAVVLLRHDLDPYEAEWNAARARVETERKEQGDSSLLAWEDEIVDQLGEEEAREILRKVPAALLRKLLSSR